MILGPGPRLRSTILFFPVWMVWYGNPDKRQSQCCMINCCYAGVTAHTYPPVLCLVCVFLSEGSYFWLQTFRKTDDHRTYNNNHPAVDSDGQYCDLFMCKTSSWCLLKWKRLRFSVADFLVMSLLHNNSIISVFQCTVLHKGTAWSDVTLECLDSLIRDSSVCMCEAGWPAPNKKSRKHTSASVSRTHVTPYSFRRNWTHFRNRCHLNISCGCLFYQREIWKNCFWAPDSLA